ncbi:hypothetical protein GCM10012287_23850 [Streptomyces daqingensis]|uniref:Lipoprotein n=1 Tax=Streptomyces daqingensis TaxID=1472640 RepID=A0ABQ2M9T3_9ACTN|nr:hypothetical protein [Streptomyces daqingensis]GGO48570.1 hypothetical protein GCM10012287_23850 [Streptomyces daqingensis]
MSQRRKRNQRAVGIVALTALAGVLYGGCGGGDGVPTGRPGKGDDFDRDDIRVEVVECATEKNPEATVKVTANTSPSDRRYFIGLDFLDADGEVVDTASLKLTPQPDSPDDEEITENVEMPMTESGKAGEVASCEMDHAF